MKNREQHRYKSIMKFSLIILQQFVRSAELREWQTSHSSNRTDRKVSLEIQVTQEILIWRTSRGLTKRRVITKTERNKKKGGGADWGDQTARSGMSKQLGNSQQRKKNGALEDKRISIDSAFEKRRYPRIRQDLN